MEAASIRGRGDETAGTTAVAAAPAIANPAPLGLAAFALTTFVLSMFNAGPRQPTRASRSCSASRSPTAGSRSCSPGMWEFRTGNTFGATAFTSYGAFWLSFWAFVQFFADEHPEGRRRPRGRALPDRLGHLHRLHVRRLAAHDGGGRGSCSCC